MPSSPRLIRRRPLDVDTCVMQTVVYVIHVFDLDGDLKPVGRTRVTFFHTDVKPIPSPNPDVPRILHKDLEADQVNKPVGLSLEIANNHEKVAEA